MNNQFYEAVLNELETLVDINSESGKEHELLRYLDDRFQGMGLETTYQPVIQDRYNLVVNPQENTLLITGHVDTVPEVLENRKCYRYTKDDLVYGRGAADTKGGIAALIIAIETFLQENSTGKEELPFTLAFTVDEENEGTGAEVLAENINCRSAIVLEPTDLKVATAQAGSVELYLDVFGEPAHGGKWDEAESAVKRTIKIINQMENLPFVNEYDELLGPGGYNLQWLKGGQKHALIVPSRCEAVIDFRVLGHQDVEEIMDVLETYLGNFELVDLEFQEYSPSFSISPEEPVVNLLKDSAATALGQEISHCGFKSWTDAQPLYEAGVTSVIFGPGSLNLSHTPHEHISVHEVFSATLILTETVRRIAYKPQYL